MAETPTTQQMLDQEMMRGLVAAIKAPSAPSTIG
jgi:hypothetical protein